MTPSRVRTPPPVLLLLHMLLLLLLACSRSAASYSDQYDCPLGEHEPAPEGARLAGDVLWAGRPERPYEPTQYRRRVDGDGFVVCTCATKPCVRKCCPPGQAFFDKKCRAPGPERRLEIGEFEVPRYVTSNGSFETYGLNSFHLIYGKPIKCIDNMTISILKQEFGFRISPDGWLRSEAINDKPPGQFCLDRFSVSPHTQFNISSLFCRTKTKEIDSDRYKLMAMIISLPFLFVTFLVYALTKKLRNLHGMSLICHVAMLLFAYTSLIAVQIISDDVNNEVCIILAYVIQFSFLASFFWLNVMCFDLWQTFRGYGLPRRNSNQLQELKKFKIYSIYAWGCTSLISIITGCMHLASFNASSTELYPDIGKNKCFFESRLANMIYFYGPIGILLFTNLLMFVYTAVMIFKQMTEAKSINRSNYKHDKQRLMLYFNLFIVMGINWLAEIISYLFEDYFEEYVWYITDYGNALQGVFIFVIFVCKKRILRLLCEQFCPRFEFFKTFNVTSTKSHSSTISKTSVDPMVNVKFTSSTGAIQNNNI